MTEQTEHQQRQGESASRAVSPLHESYLVTVASTPVQSQDEREHLE